MNGAQFGALFILPKNNFKLVIDFISMIVIVSLSEGHTKKGGGKMGAVALGVFMFIGMAWYFGVFYLLNEDKKQAYINFLNRIGRDE